MWSNNGYQDHGAFQQGNFQQNYSDDGYIPFSPAPFGQYFQNIGPTQGIQYGDLANSEQSTPGEFQSEVGLYNEEAFAQNHFRGSDGSVSILTVEARNLLVSSCLDGGLDKGTAPSEFGFSSLHLQLSIPLSPALLVEL